MRKRIDVKVPHPPTSNEVREETCAPRTPVLGSTLSAPATGAHCDSLPDAEERVRAILAKPYWDYAEAALVLNVSVKTLRNMKYRREVTFTHFGGKLYFPRQAILAELRHNTVHCRIRARDRRKASA